MPARLLLNWSAAMLLAVACGSGRPVDTNGFPPSGQIPGGGSPGDAGTPGDGVPPGSGAVCLASTLLAQLGKSTLLAGADMSAAVAEAAPFDVRTMYLAGGIGDGTSVCSSCTQSCTAEGTNCGSSSGCNWWGCWQDLSVAPGQYARDFLAQTAANGQIPMFTYYEVLQTTGVQEGSPEVVALANVTLMQRYYADWRFLLQTIGSRPALLHLEPDLWGYAEQLNADPHGQPAAVASANPGDCGTQENSVAGFARCLVAMVRKYAPAAKVGLHGSPWATGIETVANRSQTVDVAAEGRKLADYLNALGAADTDFVVVEVSDRDVGWLQSLGQNAPFWDTTNVTLPDFHQAFAWARAVTDRLQKPAIWWQLPLGNMAQPNTNNHWKDNRVDYFFAHPDEVAASGAFAMVFGAGESHQTTPSTDGGNLVARVKLLAAAGGQAACP